MKTNLTLHLTSKLAAGCAGLGLVLTSPCFAGAPYPPDAWPANIDVNSTLKVHYGVVDGAFGAPTLGALNSLSICALNQGPDQGTVMAPCIQGFTGQKGANFYMNIADIAFTDWTNVPNVDILLQVYGDLGVLNPTNSAMARRVRFQLGTSSSGYSTYTSASVQTYATNAYNSRWNWILFSITNAMWSNKVDGLLYRQMGTIKPGSSPSSGVNGGINGGTVRMQSPDNQGGLVQGMMGFTIHAMAIGEAGVFGLTNEVNLFEPPDTSTLTCPEVPAVNLVGMDFNTGTSNYLQVMTDDPGYPDQMVLYTNSIGPSGDQRTCIYPTALNSSGAAYLINFGVLSNYLGYPCQANETWKIAVDFYDDPAFATNSPPVEFGPEAYAVDGQGCAAPVVYPSSGLQILTGTGQWIRRAWYIGGGTGVNLLGVNVSPLTGGPRLICANQPVAVSRVDMAIIRASGPLAGQDPLASVPTDPLACSGVYSNFVELDLANSVTNGLDLGTSGGDQYMEVETAGPVGDQRLSVRPSFGDTGPGAYLQFPIVSNVLGPNYQDNVGLAIVVTYYDDPALIGASFGIDAWKYHLLAQEPIFAADNGKWIRLTGSNVWREAYWEIDRLDFTGVNQGPQAAVRFKCTDRIHVCRVRYAVIRPCGPTAGQNLLSSYRVTSLAAAPDAGGLMRLSWPYREPQLTLQSVPTLGASWSAFMGTPILPEGTQAVVRLAPTNSSQFFRLCRPPIP